MSLSEWVTAGVAFAALLLTGIDPDRRTITIRLDREDRLVRVPHWYLDDGHLDWGYALTGHKAQGATAQRAHTVAGDGVDREWIYVTMSRGKEANTIYLTDPDTSQDECEHLAHQHRYRLPALIAALGRAATETAAVDTGRGPETLTDEGLDERVTEVARELDAEGPESGKTDDRVEKLVEFVRLRREAEARRRDRMAAIHYEPPEWIVDKIGERPADPHRRAVWDRIVDRMTRYRIAVDFDELLGDGSTSGDVELHAARTLESIPRRELSNSPSAGRGFDRSTWAGRG